MLVRQDAVFSVYFNFDTGNFLYIRNFINLTEDLLHPSRCVGKWDAAPNQSAHNSQRRVDTAGSCGQRFDGAHTV